MIDLWGNLVNDELEEPEEKSKTMFDCINSIRDKNDIRVYDPSLKTYVPYQINRAISQNDLTLTLANDMNIMAHIPTHAQYLYFYHSTPKHTFRGKWVKGDTNKYIDKLVELGYNTNQAEELCYVMTEKSIKQLIRSKK